jgi:hypothetical protein
MLTIAIDTAKGVHQFDWDATAEEFQRLCERMEELAAEEGHDPRDIAAAAIHTTAAKGADNDPVRQRPSNVDGLCGSSPHGGEC